MSAREEGPIHVSSAIETPSKVHAVFVMGPHQSVSCFVLAINVRQDKVSILYRALIIDAFSAELFSSRSSALLSVCLEKIDIDRY